MSHKPSNTRMCTGNFLQHTSDYQHHTSKNQEALQSSRSESPIPWRNGEGELVRRFEPIRLSVPSDVGVLGCTNFVGEEALGVVNLPPVTSSIDFHLRGGDWLSSPTFPHCWRPLSGLLRRSSDYMPCENIKNDEFVNCPTIKKLVKALDNMQSIAEFS